MKFQGDTSYSFRDLSQTKIYLKTLHGPITLNIKTEEVYFLCIALSLNYSFRDIPRTKINLEKKTQGPITLKISRSYFSCVLHPPLNEIIECMNAADKKGTTFGRPDNLIPEYSCISQLGMTNCSGVKS